MTQTTTCPPEVAEPSDELIRLIAGKLTAHGISTGPPSRHDERRLPVICPHARSTLTVDEYWLVTWDWCPAAGGSVDSQRLADLACALLTGQATGQPRRDDGYDRSTVTLKGAVGRELAARGLTVGLEVYQDPVFFDVHAGIVATVPGSILDAQVRVTDDGRLIWECDYGDEGAAVTGDPASAAPEAGRELLAADIVARLTAALSVAQPGLAQRHRLDIVATGRRAWRWVWQAASGGWRRV